MEAKIILILAVASVVSQITTDDSLQKTIEIKQHTFNVTNLLPLIQKPNQTNPASPPVTLMTTNATKHIYWTNVLRTVATNSYDGYRGRIIQLKLPHLKNATFDIPLGSNESNVSMKRRSVVQATRFQPRFRRAPPDPTESYTVRFASTIEGETPAPVPGRRTDTGFRGCLGLFKDVMEHQLGKLFKWLGWTKDEEPDTETTKA